MTRFSRKITYIYSGDSIIYDNIEKWYENQGVDMLYPSKLPDGVYIDNIFKVDSDNDKEKITFDFNNESVFMAINNYHSIDIDAENSSTYTTKNGLVFYIIHNQQAVYQTETHEYVIKSNNYSWLIIILEGLK